MSYSILRVEKVKNANVTRALQRHNQRENKTYGNQDIDLTKTHLNYDLINAEKVEYEKEIERRIEEGYQGKRKIRSDAIKHVDGIITSDKAFFDKLTPERQKQFFEDSLEFVKQEYGEKNIIYATVHLDEKTPHMHFGFVPLTKDGRLSAKEVLGNKKAMSELQDRFNDFVNEKGYNLERGEKATGKEHIEIMKYKEKTLNEKISGLEREAQTLQQNIEKVRNIDQRIKEVDNFDNKTKQIFNQVTMSKKDYEAFKSVAKSGIATLHKFEDLKKTSTETFQELNQKNQELEKNQNYYMDRTHQLLQENRALKQENIELKQENKSLKREIERFKEYTRNTLLNIQYGMKKLSEKLKDSELYKVFKDKIFSPSIEIAKEKYHEDLQQEKKELASEKDKEMEM